MSDYISREAVCYQLEKQATIDGQPRAIRRAAKIVANFPAADVRPVVKAKWVPNAPHRDLRPRCTACGMLHPVRTNFCPNCGADMREES